MTHSDNNVPSKPQAGLPVRLLLHNVADAAAHALRAHGARSEAQSLRLYTRQSDDDVSGSDLADRYDAVLIGDAHALDDAPDAIQAAVRALPSVLVVSHQSADAATRFLEVGGDAVVQHDAPVQGLVDAIYGVCRRPQGQHTLTDWQQRVTLAIDHFDNVIFKSPSAELMGARRVAEVIERAKALRWPTPGRLARLKPEVDPLNGITLTALSLDYEGWDVTVMRVLLDQHQRRNDLGMVVASNLDALTGMPNRRLFLQLTQRELDRTDDTYSALVIGNVDQMRSINEAFGNAAGDELIRIMTRRVRWMVRSDDLIGHLGADEFALLLQNLSGADQAEAVARKLIERLAEPYAIADRPLTPSVSLGVAIAPDHGKSAIELLRYADLALSRAKSVGGACFRFYETSLSEDTRERWELEERVRQAAAQGQFHLVYQPVIDAGSHRVTAVEALMRWGGDAPALSPADFIPELERTGLIVSIGYQAFGDACHMAGVLFERLGREVQVSVNLSPRQFEDAGLVRRLGEIMQAHGTRPSQLALEITESVLMADPDVAKRTVSELSELGMAVYIDDFGTGYSSLSYLKHLPVAGLKIDRSFIKDLPAAEKDSAITLSTIDLAMRLELQVVAEGVETADQAEMLTTAGAHRLQGFHFSAGLAPDALLHWLHDQGLA